MMIFFTGNMHAADKYTLNNECSIVVLWLGEPQTLAGCFSGRYWLTLCLYAEIHILFYSYGTSSFD